MYIYVIYLPLQRCTQFKVAACELGKKLVAEKEGVALLQCAAQLGDERIIHLLCDCGVKVNKKSCLTESTPLLIAVSRGCHPEEKEPIESVKALIQRGAKDSVNAENKDGDTPLFMAIRRRHKNVFITLLIERADPTKLDEAGNTILHAAAEVNATEICKEIMKRTYNRTEILAAKNHDDQTAIHLAAMHKPDCLNEIIEGLDAKEVEWFSAVDSKGCTPLDIAAKAGQQATFKFMWDEMKKYSAAHIDVERRILKSLIKEAEKDPSEWQKVTDAIRAFPKRM